MNELLKQKAVVHIVALHRFIKEVLLSSTSFLTILLVFQAMAWFAYNVKPWLVLAKCGLSEFLNPTQNYSLVFLASDYDAKPLLF